MYILCKPKVEPSQKIYSGGRFWDLPPWVVRTKGRSSARRGTNLISTVKTFGRYTQVVKGVEKLPKK